MSNEGSPTPPTEEEVAKFEMLMPMLLSAHEEVRELSKKKQDGLLSKVKVGWINQLLSDAKQVLGQHPAVHYLDILDEEQVPQNSDAALLLGRYLAAMEHFKGTHRHRGEWDTQERRAEEEEYQRELRRQRLEAAEQKGGLKEL